MIFPGQSKIYEEIPPRIARSTRIMFVPLLSVLLLPLRGKISLALPLYLVAALPLWFLSFGLWLWAGLARLRDPHPNRFQIARLSS